MPSNYYLLFNCPFNDLLQFISQGDNNTKICGHTSLHCYDYVEYNSKLVDLEPGFGSYEKIKKRAEGECDCLPSCTSIRYDAEVSETDYDRKDTLKSFGGNFSMNPE